MDDKTLLERAARAAGYVVDGYVDDMIVHPSKEKAGGLVIRNEQGGHSLFNALTDDGDEARLEAALNLHVKWGHQHVVVGSHPCNTWQEAYYLHNGDKQKARRYAGVRAAAAIWSAHEAQ